ncbi:MAG TPA: NAD kinase [Prolixibacteraceae bacterium]|nr:NAD kinase [Prolixibacteraceae bacterium]HPT30268.1 NAD kinase [Prolixibacteraceae bacterium]
MKVAVFGTVVHQEFIPVLQAFFLYMKKRKVETYLCKPFYDFLSGELGFTPDIAGTYTNHTDFQQDISFIFSVGGDGTFLHSFRTIRNSNIPIVGVNSGRMGFLADISREEIIEGLTLIMEGQYRIYERSLLELTIGGSPGFDFPYALNEVTVSKTDSSSMIVIHTSINGTYLNSIWADGLIIATPTGSTAYSLSVGGPILTPDAANFVINPIAPHNLTVRPVVVPDSYELSLSIEGRGNQFLISMDSLSANVALSTTINVKKAGFRLKTLHLPHQDFFQTLRSKLMWAVDKRN